MAISKAPATDSIVNRLTDRLCSIIETQYHTSITRFTHHFFSVSDHTELERQSLDTLNARILSYWQILQTFNAKQPLIKVFNPDLEQHGWHSPHTVIQVHNCDTPFLVKSVRMVLERQGLSIHELNNCVIHVTRDKQGKFIKLTEPSDIGNPTDKVESVIHLEVDLQPSSQRLKEIHDDLNESLGDVSAAVQSFSQIQQQALKIQKQLSSSESGKASSGAQEVAAFIDWLLDDNFVFVGYKRLLVTTSKHANSKPVIKVEPNSALGIAARLSNLGNEVFTKDGNETISHGKEGQRSRIQRPAYLDRIVIPEYDADNRLTATHQFYGLYTSSVYQVSPKQIPIVRCKVQTVLDICGFEAEGYNYKEIKQILNEMPRDELLLASTDELATAAYRIFNLQERRKASLLVRRDPSNGYYSCLYYVHRELYNSGLRKEIEQLLATELQAEDIEVSTRVSQSTLSCTHFMVYRPNSSAPALETLNRRALELSHSWNDELHNSLIENLGEAQGSQLSNQFKDAFPSAYKEHFSAKSGACDVRHLTHLNSASAIEMSFYREIEHSKNDLKFKLYSADGCVILSDVIPILENLGMRVIGEHPYLIKCNDKASYWISDFTVSILHSENLDFTTLKPLLQEAFIKAWHGLVENDSFNHLVMGAMISWREVTLFRAYARYIKQLRFGFSQQFIAETLAQHVGITQQLLALFINRFDPAIKDEAERAKTSDEIEQTILDALDLVESLDHDRILRRYLELIKATLRTNFYQTKNGHTKEYISLKLNPRAISNIPQPCPMFEVFIYSPRVEGVHLRAGRVARGGLRWSDRMEDYRTEVLGLVKAQQVKNAVIVPMGAKGCFIAKQLPIGGDREAVQNEGISCYQTYIRGLLDITDNRIGNDIVPPIDVVRHDEDDPYLVVAADKGTATFSDIANQISADYKFWLHDAFASGGSEGYDHKKMGITAKGAWESVKRHFREQGVDVQSQPFTAIGIGDMGGDVFGNGMLLSRTMHLQAAFNHLHIFIDPNPDSESAYNERQRLFNLPRSSWADYDSTLISKGGAILSRSAKWVKITPQMKAAFDISSDRLSPHELITALLKAPVDLLWNGGIGTYVKAKSETDADVGDKANDALRINGCELRCKVLGEGGNLGFTQQGRIEFAQNGGAANTDFIDNAGGVDCSDHEVNIKILLNELIHQGDMTLKQRNQLQREMTDEVAELVLKNNYRQCQALNIAEVDANETVDDYIRLIRALESKGSLDRTLEKLPTDKELSTRKTQGKGLTRPELSVLISYVKIEIKQALIDSWVTEDSSFKKEAYSAFPQRLLAKFPEAISQHRLCREICATQIANDLVNRLGITFAHRITHATGASVANIAAAYLNVRNIYGIDKRWEAIEALDTEVENSTLVKMMKEQIRLIARACHWMLRNHPNDLNLDSNMTRYSGEIESVVASLDQLAMTIPPNRWQPQLNAYIDAGVPELPAAFAASAGSIYWLLDIIDLTHAVDVPLTQISAVYFSLGEQLELTWLDREIRAFQSENHWQTLAISSYRNELDTQLRTLTKSVFMTEESNGKDAALDDPSEQVKKWLVSRQSQVSRWQRTLSDIKNAKIRDCSVFAVALSVLLELA